MVYNSSQAFIMGQLKLKISHLRSQTIRNPGVSKMRPIKWHFWLQIIGRKECRYDNLWGNGSWKHNLLSPSPKSLNFVLNANCLVSTIFTLKGSLKTINKSDIATAKCKKILKATRNACLHVNCLAPTVSYLKEAWRLF